MHSIFCHGSNYLIPIPQPHQPPHDSHTVSVQPTEIIIKGEEPKMGLYEIRKAALAKVRQSADEKCGKGRMKGKVGIITGAGPPMGIGVSDNINS